MKKILKNITPIKKLLIIIVLIASIYIVPTLAKFIVSQFDSFFTSSKDFYYTSNLLTERGKLYKVENWSGVGSFNISFDLLSLKNEYTYTDYDIPYTITFTCPNDVTCSSNKNSGIIYHTSATHSDTITLSVNLTRTYLENESLTVHVEAESTSPYVKKLQANFQYIVGKSGVSYEIEDEANRTYLVFKITNAVSFCTVTEAFGNYTVGSQIDSKIYKTLSSANKSKCISQMVSLSFNPSDVILDTTNSIIDRSTYTSTTVNGTDYINSFTFGVAPSSTIAIRFYKTNTSNNYTYPLVNQTSIITLTSNNVTVGG